MSSPLHFAIGFAACSVASLVASHTHAQAIEQLPLSKQVLLADPDLQYDPYSVMVKFSPAAT